MYSFSLSYSFFLVEELAAAADELAEAPEASAARLRSIFSCSKVVEEGEELLVIYLSIYGK